jgi:predicted Zn-dependent protease
VTLLKLDSVKPPHLEANSGAGSFAELKDETIESMPDWLYDLEPIVNKMHDRDRQVRAAAIRQLRPFKNRSFVSQVRPFQSDAAPAVREEANKKLGPIESYYRRRFFYFQNQTRIQPNYPGYRFGLAIVCLRYSQVWVRDISLRDHFLGEALKQLNRLIRTHEPKPIYFYYRGHVLSHLRRAKLAIEDFTKVLTAKPRHRGAALALMDLYFRTQQPQLAFEIADSLPALYPPAA